MIREELIEHEDTVDYEELVITGFDRVRVFVSKIILKIARRICPHYWDEDQYGGDAGTATTTCRLCGLGYWGKNKPNLRGYKGRRIL